MEIRQAKQTEVLEIFTIITQTKDYFKDQQIDQWQGEYPNLATVIADIELGQCYVAVEKELIVGLIVVSFVEEISYQRLNEGDWINQEPYSVIHRLAINNDYQGQGTSLKLLSYGEEVTLKAGRRVIRTDTHENNQGMAHILTKMGYKKQGALTLADGSPRIAYDKVLGEDKKTD